MSKNAKVSAQVVLRGASGKRHDAELITAANIASHLPSAVELAKVMKYFEAAGFEVGTAAGTSFSITAPAVRFEALFGRSSGGGELPIDRLPANIQAKIETVTFARPLDFGPGSY